MDLIHLPLPPDLWPLPPPSEMCVCSLYVAVETDRAEARQHLSVCWRTEGGVLWGGSEVTVEFKHKDKIKFTSFHMEIYSDEDSVRSQSPSVNI